MDRAGGLTNEVQSMVGGLQDNVRQQMGALGGAA